MNPEKKLKPSDIPPPPWEGTTEAMSTPGGRDLSDYKAWLGFNEAELEGKVVLDLGSGSFEKLSRDLKKLGSTAKVISLNPEYGPEDKNKYRNILHNIPDWQHKSVAGVAQSLPFADASIDVILGLQSVSMYADNFAELWSQEIARVLKSGGTARLAEVLGLNDEKTKLAWQKIIDLLKELGLTATIETFKIKEKNPKDRCRLIIKKI